MAPGRRPSSHKRLNIAGMGALSRRLMALEKARALGKKPLDLRGWALEREAEAWAERWAAGGGLTAVPVGSIEASGR